MTIERPEQQAKIRGEDEKMEMYRKAQKAMAGRHLSKVQAGRYRGHGKFGKK
jgi:hypothetical protein